MNWITENWDAIILILIAIYEFITRVIPTSSNWSLLDKLYGILLILAPNNGDSNTQFRIGKNPKRGLMDRIIGKNK